MTHGSLFSGIGGFDLAAEWMGWENMFHCEWNEFGQKVLKHYWPNAISYGDITKTDFTIHRGRINVLTGGFPCQPYSMAGKRKGKEDDRHLWPEMLRAIREIQPEWVVGENVFGIINWSGGLVFEEVQTDLEAEGYEVQPYVLPACAVNAPHRRDRVWFVAHYKDDRRNKNKCGVATNTTGAGRKIGLQIGTKQTHTALGDNGIDGTTANTRLLRQEITEEQTTGVEQCDENDGNYKEVSVHYSKNKSLTTNEQWAFADTNSRRQSCKKYGQEKSRFITKESISRDWQNFPTQSPLCGRDDGLSSRLDGITFPKWRNESIKAYGNAIVPQVALQIFKAIENYELSNM